jgi:hypothetical protein
VCCLRDWWMPTGPLVVTPPELFYHSMLQSTSVHQVFNHGLASILAPRLSSVASRQRYKLLQSLSFVPRNLHARTLPPSLLQGQRPAQTSTLYKLCTFGRVLDEGQAFVWRNFALSKVKFFRWLLVKSHIQCRAHPRDDEPH